MVTIILPVSRSLYLDRIFARLELLTCDSDTNLFVYVDGDYNLYQKARNFTVKSKFAEKLCIYRNKNNANVGSVSRRRNRIAKIHNEIKEYIKEAEYLFLIEDDTIFYLDTLERLLSSAYLYSFAGIISGVEIGRWGFEHIGAWKIDNVYDPHKITSVALEKDIKEVDATGLYCCLVKKELYLNFNFEPFDDVLGPDVAFGIHLRKLGLKNYVDYNIKCTHLTQKGEIDFKSANIVQVEFNKKDDKWVLGKI